MPPPFTLTRAQVRDLDRRAAEGFGVPGLVLMENAGRGCAELLMTLNPEKRPTVLLCGPGNNGGDGFVIARHLDNRGWPVDVQVVAKNNREAGDADVFFDILFTACIPFTQHHPEHCSPQTLAFLRRRIEKAGWVVDALFGTGLSRPLAAPYDELVAIVNASGNPVLAVDIPFGSRLRHRRAARPDRSGDAHCHVRRTQARVPQPEVPRVDRRGACARHRRAAEAGGGSIRK